MTYEEIPSEIRHCIGQHECFRRLGFTPDEIFVGSAGGMALVILQAQGKEFVVDVAVTKMTQLEFSKAWTESAQNVRDGKFDQADLKRMFSECIGARESVSLLLALKAKGIDWRCVPMENLN